MVEVGTVGCTCVCWAVDKKLKPEAPAGDGGSEDKGAELFVMKPKDDGAAVAGVSAGVATAETPAIKEKADPCGSCLSSFFSDAPLISRPPNMMSNHFVWRLKETAIQRMANRKGRVQQRSHTRSKEGIVCRKGNVGRGYVGCVFVTGGTYRMTNGNSRE